MNGQHSGTFYDPSSPTSPTSPTSPPWQANTSAPLDPPPTDTASSTSRLRHSSSSNSSSRLHADSFSPSSGRADHRQSGQSFQPTIAASHHSTLSGSTVAPAESGPAQHQVYWEGYAAHEANQQPHMYAEYAAQRAEEQGAPPRSWVENMDPHNPEGGTLYTFFTPPPVRGENEAEDYMERYNQVMDRYNNLPEDVYAGHLVSEMGRLVDPDAPSHPLAATVGYWTNAMTRLDNFTRNMNAALNERHERMRQDAAARLADQRRREELEAQRQREEQQSSSSSRGILRRVASSLTIGGSSNSSKKNKRKKETSLGTQHDHRDPFATISSRTAARYQI